MTVRPRAGARRAVLAVSLAVLTGALLVSAAAAKQPRRAYTPAGTALAKSIVLRLSDLPPAWKADPSGSGGGGSVTCKSFDPDQSDLTTVGHAERSYESRDGLATASSIIGVFQSAAQARTSWNRVVRPAMLDCISQLFSEGASNKTTKTRVLSARRYELSVPAPRSAAYRLVADVATQGTHIRAYLDLIFAAGGSANTVMLVTSLVSPPTAAFERRLAAAIAARLPE
jgi:hypothetical protein